MASGRASWSALAETIGAPERFGAKAEKLARASRHLPVVEGWALDTHGIATLDRAGALALAESLLELHPATRWLLRSSSPLEDMTDASAAGLFSTVDADAVPESVADALLRVAASARDPRLRALLGKSDVPALPLALLAQPHLHFRRWCTVEWRGPDALLEGWSVSEDGAPRWMRSVLTSLPRPWHALRDLAERVHAWEENVPLLLELGEDLQGAVWLLQSRRAPRAAPHWSPATDVVATEVPELAGLGAHVHPEDEHQDWEWDREHCPTPLCPLLAGLFADFIVEHPEHPSRLVHGRWHDARSGTGDVLMPTDVEHELEIWRAHEETTLRPALARLGALVEPHWTEDRAGARWQDFTREWLHWQASYYATNSSALRRWARAQCEEGAREGRAAPRLGPTVAAQRARRWRELAGEVHRHPAAPVATAQAVQIWAETHSHDRVSRALYAELERCGHLCAFAFDGRGIPWEFDAMPFWRAIAIRMREKTPAPRALSEPDSTGPGRWVSAILARAEDDDDLLLQAYHLWHRALRRIASAAGDPGLHETTVLLDLLPADLMRWTQHFDAGVLRDGLARGRALAHAWNAWSPPSSGSTRIDRLTGTPAAPGRAEGPVRRALHLEEIEDAEGTVAVVATVSPSDAVHVPGLAALVCEGGDVLGHASVLARESGVPCVVGVGQARLRLGQAVRLLVDGDRGEIVVTATRS